MLVKKDNRGNTGSWKKTYYFIVIEFQKINAYYKPSQSFDTFKVSVE